MPLPPDPARPGAQATEQARRTLGRIFSALSLASSLLAAAIGTIATNYLGPSLAMGVAIYMGNTEPRKPMHPYPWVLFALGCLVAIAGAVVARRQPRHKSLANAVVHGAATFLALLPFWHIYQLYRLT